METIDTFNLPGVLYRQLPRADIVGVMKFDNDGDFASITAAEENQKGLGYKMGIMCSPEPIAFMRGMDYIAKWKNLNKNERRMVHGVIVAENFRNGPVYVVTFKED